jgi:hypothetical protein
MNQAALKKPAGIMTGYRKANSFCHCLAEVLPYVSEQPLSYTEIMGYTGLAFHINVEVSSINKWGPAMYDWGGIHIAGIKNLGLQARMSGCSGPDPHLQQIRQDVIEIAKKSIDNGVPAILWEARGPEFGLAYGYDDCEEAFVAADWHGEGRLAYDQIGAAAGAANAETDVISVTAIEHMKVIDRREALTNALKTALFYGFEDCKVWHDFVSGLDAYDVWTALLSQDRVDPYGNAYSMHAFRDAREQAARFLRKSAHSDFLNVQARRKLEEAAGYYATTADSFYLLQELFPFPEDRYTLDRKNAQLAIGLLKEAKEHEHRGLSSIADAVNEM